MAIFQNVLWGYELTFPDDLAHKTVKVSEVFAAISPALESKVALQKTVVKG
jgi:hypothetical protein